MLLAAYPDLPPPDGCVTPRLARLQRPASFISKLTLLTTGLSLALSCPSLLTVASPTRGSILLRLLDAETSTDQYRLRRSASGQLVLAGQPLSSFAS